MEIYAVYEIYFTTSTSKSKSSIFTFFSFLVEDVDSLVPFDNLKRNDSLSTVFMLGDLGSWRPVLLLECSMQMYHQTLGRLLDKENAGLMVRTTEKYFLITIFSNICMFDFLCEIFIAFVTNMKIYILGFKVTLYYFYGPIMILILLNIVLFAWTTFLIYKVNRETARSMRGESRRTGEDNDRQR